MHQARGNESNYVKKKAIGTRKRNPHPAQLQAVLDDVQSTCIGPALIVTACGKTRTEAGFTNWFRDFAHQGRTARGFWSIDEYRERLLS